MPKAMAAARRLSAVNSTIRIEPLATDVNAANIPELAGLSPGARRVDLILDGTDNIATRYLINDLSVKHAIPWVYGACVGTEGRSMAIVPGHTPCLRCLFPTAPHPSEIATCDTAGVLGPAAAVVASLQTTAAIRILTGQWTQAADCLWTLDLWASRVLAVQTHAARRADCPCCGQRRFDFLDSPPRDSSVTLCGRDAVQVASDSRTPLSLDAAAQRLRTAGSIQQSKFLLRCHLHEPSGIVLSLFPDGRLIVHGTSDPARAKAIYARFIGM
jgi:adenylyltransferase/sulfurtransferase